MSKTVTRTQIERLKKQFSGITEIPIEYHDRIADLMDRSTDEALQLTVDEKIPFIWPLAERRLRERYKENGGFKIGLYVAVNPDYQDGQEHRKEVGQVIAQVCNLDIDLADDESLEDTHFVDNIVKFPDGTVEPFGNWELIPIIS